MSANKDDSKKRKLNSEMKTQTAVESNVEDEWMSDDENQDNTNCFDSSEVPIESNVIKPFPIQYKLKKRAPTKGNSIKRNDIYVSRKSKFHALFSRGKTLLEQGSSFHATNSIQIHGLGAAITTAIDLALALQQYFGGPSQLDFNITTETVPLVDDFYTRDMDEYYRGSQVRFNSAIHIVCTRVPRKK
ncbi:hypothetical protein C9374_002701 [Naegleria lovaniensis]|uniref:Uncharacterized protein n=1 Tax=Naegleria lovaniensis TaxID=51637 RepID=A0AA88GNY6_NAELO|nr:uncharacterized protein C9374_002701 [Naegleria lovaniensis]KAG2386255.1 hypothetical protein C9374_002701 [Naegleria lovaniensis]